MITREECEKALNTLQEKYIGFDVVDELIDFKMLIKEHFDNPPLKFEELEEGMWIWDNNWKQYFEICEIYPKTKEFDVLIHQNRINRLRYEPMKFEENRFYKKKVK